MPREHGDDARRQCVERVFAAVYEPLQRYVRRRANASAVDDVVAETLLVVWRRLDDLPADAELAWCYGTARGCLANHRRASGRRDRLVTRLSGEPTAHRQQHDGENRPDTSRLHRYTRPFSGRSHARCKREHQAQLHPS